MKFIYIFLFVSLFLNIDILYSASLSINYEYRLRGLSYPNLDFDMTTNDDAKAYYTQRMNFMITGKFEPNIEIYTKIQSIGIVNSTFTLKDYDWQKEYPYPKTDFTPFIENAYFKVKKIGQLPVDVVIGKQPIEYGTGLIVSDNGAGFNALKFIVDYPKILDHTLHTEIFTAKIIDNFRKDSDFDLYGSVFSYLYKENNFEISYFEEKDDSKTVYKGRPIISENSTIIYEAQTKNITRKFYEFRLFRETEISYLNIEYIIGRGNIVKEDDSKINLNNYAWLVSGYLIGEKTRLGKVTAKLTLSGSSGDDLINQIVDDDESFSPTFRKRFDGLERIGWGKIFSSNFTDTFFDVSQNNFSGFGVIALEVFFTPWYGWNFNISNFLYSASNTFLHKGATETSKFEKLYLGQQYNLGAEMDLGLNYVYSKYLEFSFGFSRYTPPSYAGVWPKHNTVELYSFETITRF